jgi:ADYC domain
MRVCWVVMMAVLGYNVLGCDAEPGADAAQRRLGLVEAPADAIAPQGITMQGITMQGVTMQGTEHSGVQLKGFRLSSLALENGVAVEGVALEGGELVGSLGRHTLRGTALAGLRLEAELTDGRRRRVRIAEVWPEPQEQGGVGVPALRTFRYVLVEERDGGAQPLCAPAADGVAGALAVSGIWDARGAHHADADLFTFSCAQGVIAKCYRWGYRPWDRQGALADAHQACTRMARADYCGDGRTFTRPGTLINVADALAPPIQIAADAGMLFEAGWTVHGAACFSHRRWLEVRGELHDDRCTAAFETEASACDSAAEAFASDSGVLLVNESRPQLLDGGAGSAP